MKSTVIIALCLLAAVPLVMGQGTNRFGNNVMFDFGRLNRDELEARFEEPGTEYSWTRSLDASNEVDQFAFVPDAGDVVILRTEIEHLYEYGYHPARIVHDFSGPIPIVVIDAAERIPCMVVESPLMYDAVVTALTGLDGTTEALGPVTMFDATAPPLSYDVTEGLFTSHPTIRQACRGKDVVMLSLQARATDPAIPTEQIQVLGLSDVAHITIRSRPDRADSPGLAGGALFGANGEILDAFGIEDTRNEGGDLNRFGNTIIFDFGRVNRLDVINQIFTPGTEYSWTRDLTGGDTVMQYAFAPDAYDVVILRSQILGLDADYGYHPARIVHDFTNPAAPVVAIDAIEHIPCMVIDNPLTYDSVISTLMEIDGTTEPLGPTTEFDATADPLSYADVETLFTSNPQLRRACRGKDVVRLSLSSLPEDPAVPTEFVQILGLADVGNFKVRSRPGHTMTPGFVDGPFFGSSGEIRDILGLGTMQS